MVKYQLSCMINVTIFFYCSNARLTWQHFIICFFMQLWCPRSFVLQYHLLLLYFNGKISASITPMEKQCEIRGNVIKQILNANKNHQLVFQKHDISNRDILRTLQWYSFLGYSREYKLLCLSLGNDTFASNISYLKTFFSRG